MSTSWWALKWSQPHLVLCFCACTIFDFALLLMRKLGLNLFWIELFLGGKHLIFSPSKTVNFTFAQMLDLLGGKIDINIFCSRWNLNCEQHDLGELKWLLLTWAMWFLCVDISTSLAQQIQGESGRLWGKSFCVKAFEYLFFMISIPSAEVQSLRERRKGKGGIITLMMRWHRTYFGEHFWFFTHFPKLRQIYPEAIAVFHKLVRWKMVVMTGSVNQKW